MKRQLSQTLAALALTTAGTAVAADSSVDFPAGCMPAGTGVFLENAWARVTFQGDGNLVMYAKDGTGAKWATGTQGSGESLCVQGDGNLVVYGGGAARWASGTHQRGVTRMKMNRCGFDLLDGEGNVEYSVARDCAQTEPEDASQIVAGTCFEAGAGVIAENGSAQLSFDGTGKLALIAKDGSGVKWSKTASGSDERLCFKDDGNLVLTHDTPLTYKTVFGIRYPVPPQNDAVVWKTSTAGSGAEVLDLDGCGFALLDADGAAQFSVSKACSQVEAEHSGQMVMDGACFPAQATWLATTDYLKLAWQGDGNLVIYRADGSGAVWGAGTQGRGRELCLEEGGEMVIYGDGDAVLWSSGATGDVLELTGLGIQAAGAADDLSITGEDSVVYDADPVEEPRLVAYAEGHIVGDLMISREEEAAAIEENHGNRFDQSWERSNSFGNGEFGGGYAFGLEANATEIFNEKLYAYAAAYGDTYGIVFGKRLTILGARFEAETDGNENDSGATVTVLNIDIDVELLDREVELFSVSKTFVEKSKTFMAGPVPITVAGDLTGTLSATAELNFGATGISLTVTPQAVLTGTAQAGVGAACVSAGIRGALDLVDIQVPTTASLTVNPFSLDANLNLSSELTVSSLGGSLSLYADYCVGEAELEIVGWDGVPVASVELVDHDFAL